jgi:hypothetical protein
MSDEMLNKGNPAPKKGVKGIGDTAYTHYDEFDMNKMNDPIDDAVEHGSYSKGQSTKGSK